MPHFLGSLEWKIKFQTKAMISLASRASLSRHAVAAATPSGRAVGRIDSSLTASYIRIARQRALIAIPPPQSALFSAPANPARLRRRRNSDSGREQADLGSEAKAVDKGDDYRSDADDSSGGGGGAKFPWRLAREPPRRVAEPSAAGGPRLLDMLTGPLQRAFTGYFAVGIAGGAFGTDYFAREFLVGAATALGQLAGGVSEASRALAQAAGAPSTAEATAAATAVKADGEAGGASPSLREAAEDAVARVGRMVTPAMQDVLVAGLRAAAAAGQVVTLRMEPLSVVIRDTPVLFGAALRPHERLRRSVRLRSRGGASRVWDVVSVGARRGVDDGDSDAPRPGADVVYEWHQLAWRLRGAEIKNAADRRTVGRLCVEAMERGAVVKVDVEVVARVEYECRRVGASAGSGGTAPSASKLAEEGSVLTQESCVRELAVRFEANHIQPTDASAGRARETVRWKIADLDHLVESEAVRDFEERLEARLAAARRDEEEEDG
ncbi:hypothetical protein HK405_008210 [Cladochytrium tenue]|nr:hypothetical protein HK405_008210 [Cladochytrium tenue]